METLPPDAVFSKYPRVTPMGKPFFVTSAVLFVLVMVFYFLQSIFTIKAIEKVASDLHFKIDNEWNISMQFSDDSKIAWDFKSFAETGSSIYLSEPTSFQAKELQKKMNDVHSAGTLGLVKGDLSDSANAMKSLMFSLVYAFLALPSLLFVVVTYMLVYKGWKCLLPVQTINPEQGRGVSSPALAVVLFFVPIFQWFWAFYCYMRYEKYGKILAEHAGIPYRGPSFITGLALGLLYFLGGTSAIWILIPFVLNPEGGIMWELSITLQILSQLIWIYATFRLWLMVRDFAPLNTVGPR